MPRTKLNGMERNGSGFNWSHLVPTATVGALLFGGSWAVFQTQFASIEKSIGIAKGGADHDIQVLTERIGSNENELRVYRSRYLTQDEFKQFETRIDDLKKRIEAIEATRPTADTLQTVSTALEKRITDLANDLRSNNNRLTKSPVDRPEIEAVREHLNALEGRVDALVKANPPR